MPKDTDSLIRSIVKMYNQFNIGYDNAIIMLTNCGLTEAQADAKLFGYVAPQGALGANNSTLGSTNTKRESQ